MNFPQALNWLLRSVSSPSCLHDLLWFFVAALDGKTDAPSANSGSSPAAAAADPSPAAAAAAAAAGGEEKVAKEKKNRKNQKELNDVKDSSSAHASSSVVGLCEHPTSDIYIAGSAIQPLPETFHYLLQTVSDLMLLLPVGSALQQIAIRCWGIKFKSTDHQFLHKSHVFSTISRILSRSDDLDTSTINNASANMSMFDISALTHVAGNEGSVEKTDDVTGNAEIKVSSRQAMVASLSDNSTETFWESGDEDRNKSKWIAITSPGGVAGAPFKNVALHVDNGRDLGNKVSSVTFKVGKSMDDATAVAKQVDVESRFAGWINCFLDANPEHSVVKIELKGPDNTLRVRQVKALGGGIGGGGLFGGPEKDLNNPGLVTIQQRNCEAETLRVFRLITGQVFGRLLEESHHENEDGGIKESPSSAASDLKEHVVGILFSRSKLTHLQKQVCAHIVQAIKKETARFREEWETLLCSETPPLNQITEQRTSDTYCFEMLSMVLALSGSSVGRSYLAQQFGLLKDLLALLHTGSGRIQRQVISLLRRVLPKVPPQGFATLLGIANLPPKEFGVMTRSTSTEISEEQDMSFLTNPGLLDVFLSCIAKALTLQVKTKGLSKESGLKGQTTTVSLGTSIHPRDDRVGGERWWLRGAMSKKIAEEIIALLKDLSQVSESCLYDRLLSKLYRASRII